MPQHQPQFKTFWNSFIGRVFEKFKEHVYDEKTMHEFQGFRNVCNKISFSFTYHELSEALLHLRGAMPGVLVESRSPLSLKMERRGSPGWVLDVLAAAYLRWAVWTSITSLDLVASSPPWLLRMKLYKYFSGFRAARTGTLSSSFRLGRMPLFQALLLASILHLGGPGDACLWKFQGSTEKQPELLWSQNQVWCEGSCHVRECLFWVLCVYI